MSIADRERLRALVPALAGRRVVVVGDVFLDQYLVGRPTRLSREAPVPVLELTQTFCRAGGAANPAVNVRALGSAAYLVGVAGDDAARATLVAELEQAGLGPDGLVVRAGSRTATKTRLLAEDGPARQHVARLDALAPRPDEATAREIERALRAAAAAPTDALLLSNYQSGVVNAATIGLARELGRERGLLTTADSQGDLTALAGLDLVKCNLAEAEAAAHRPLETEQAVERAGQELLAALGARYVVITRGGDGISAFERDRPPTHLPAANRTEVFDVTGAGDTVIAVLTLALAAGATLAEATRLANLAAGLVVRRLGVATVSPAELVAALGRESGEQERK